MESLLMRNVAARPKPDSVGLNPAPTAATESQPPWTASPATCAPSLLDRPWFILCLLFFVTAILGLPLLWISRGFSRTWKIALSVIVTLYTALLLWGFWRIMNWSVSRIMDSLS